MNVIITGASRGLGKAMAEKFAQTGDHLYLCSQHSVGLSKTIDDLKRQYPKSHIHGKAFNLGADGAAAQFGNWVLDHDVTPDIIINNAGRFIPGSVHNEAEGALEELMEVNLYSAYHLTRTLLPSMMRQKKGHIFNICSIASLQAYPNGGAYSITKFALAGFSRNLREEMKPHGIKVTAVYPGAAWTDSWADSGVAPGRIMEAEDISAMVLAASRLSPQATVEEITMRPQLGDL